MIVKRTCPTCRRDQDIEVCDGCKGSGYAVETHRNEQGKVIGARSITCPLCQGTGWPKGVMYGNWEGAPCAHREVEDG